MTIYETIKEKLELHPDFRERRFRKNKLAFLALQDMGITPKEAKFKDWQRKKISLDLEYLSEFASKYDSYRHEYDAVQKDCENLQGKDYGDGKILAEEKMLEFGYSPNFNSNVRQLKML